MSDPSEFEPIASELIPLDASGNCLVDLYVRLPVGDRFVRFIPAGDPIDSGRIEALSEHPDPHLYVLKSSDTSDSAPLVPIEMPADEFKVEFIGKDTQAELKEMFKSFLDPIAPPGTMLAKIESHANSIVNAIAPETKELKSHLMRNVKYLNLMNDASAITAIAILIAMAAGYDSKKSYKDLTYACLIMDAALSEFDEAVMHQYYRDPEQLDPLVRERIRKHPQRSHQLATEKMKSLSDVSLQLVLNHHELFNGKGYPRGVRYESLFPMVKVLSFAVDIFELIKRHELNNQILNFSDAISHFKDDQSEPHLCRHSKKLVKTVLDFLSQNPETIGTAKS